MFLHHLLEAMLKLERDKTREECAVEVERVLAFNAHMRMVAAAIRAMNEGGSK